jgi:hypothetical protein
MSDYLLSTVDNKFNPYEDWEGWFNWDSQAGYNSLGLLARVIRTSPELSEADQHLAYEQAVEEIVDMFEGFYIKVPNPKPSESSGVVTSDS